MTEQQPTQKPVSTPVLHDLNKPKGLTQEEKVAIRKQVHRAIGTSETSSRSKLRGT